MKGKESQLITWLVMGVCPPPLPTWSGVSAAVLVGPPGPGVAVLLELFASFLLPCDHGAQLWCICTLVT